MGDNFFTMNAFTEERKLTKGERTARSIMDVSERLFAERGYVGTSLRDVAAEVGIREPGLYRYFKSKEELYQQVLERALRPLSDKLDALLIVNEGEFPQNLPAEMFDLLSQSPHVATLLQQAMSGGFQHQAEDDSERWLDLWLKELIDKGRRLLTQLGVQREVSDVEMTLQIINMFNLCTGYFASAKALEKLTGQSADSQQSLMIQKKMLLAVSQVILLES